MKERLKELRTALNLTQQEFADRIGIQRGTYAKYEVGRNDPIDAVIRLICQTFNVNEEWLRTGAGQMFVDVSRADELARLIEETMSDESGEIKRRIATAVLRLTPDQLRACTDWIKETFGLVEATAAESEEDQKEKEIQAKLASYEAELRAEANSEKLGVSPTGNDIGAKDA